MTVKLTGALVPPAVVTVTLAWPAVAVEPMVNVGSHDIRVAGDGWSVYSRDGSLAAHFEHTVAIGADGPRILTPWHLEETAGTRSEAGLAASGHP